MKMKRKTEKILWYVVISMFLLIIEGFIIGYISSKFSEDVYILGMRFDVSFFIWGIFLISLTLILFLLFPSIKKRGEL